MKDKTLNYNFYTNCDKVRITDCRGKKMGITTVILTYKEEDNIKLLLPEVIKNLKMTNTDFEILVVDSQKSKDNTKSICEQYDSVKYYVQEGLYFIDALKTAIKYAQKDIFLYIDADLSHPPEYIPEIYKAFTSSNADLVIGSRYVKGGKTDDSFKNIVYSKILNLIYKILSGVHNVEDISGGYKMYRTDILKKINFISKYFEMQIEILVKAKLENPNLKIVEVPIHFKKRENGSSKRNYSKFLPHFILTFIRLFLYKFFYNIVQRR